MTWLPFYKEVVQVLATYENRQNELLDLLRAMQSAGLTTMQIEDKTAKDGALVPLEEIDPFTFLANFHRSGETTRKELWKFLREKWNVGEPVPNSFDGLPILNPQSVWFFRYKFLRKPEDIPTLWQLFQIGRTSQEIPAELFGRALKINGVGVGKLTIGLFWINAEKYLTLDDTMRQYLERFGITPNLKQIATGDIDGYLQLIGQIHETLGYDHIKISSDAWFTKSAKLPVNQSQDNTEDDPLPDNTLTTPQPPFPVNQILYGPPGTGKTYSSIARALEIIDGAVPDDRAETVARFEKLRAAGRIGFVTFHQSFAYEEFVEGLRPVLDDDADGTARYEISDGVFKQMALQALAATLQVPPQTEKSGLAFETLWDEFLSRIESDEPYEISGFGSGKYCLEISPRGTIYGENIGGAAQRPYNTSRGEVHEVWEKLGAGEKPTNKRMLAILGRGAHTNLIGAIIEELRRIAAQDGSTLAQTTPVLPREITSEDARDWLNGASEMEMGTGDNTAPRFVLIIDEINRGNIAKIFGELITLLEKDKRLGSQNKLRVTLPYSKETFGVPSNLYLLGTMNTADKSLALLDIALRRRFEFEELRPNFAVCENLDATMHGVLDSLNARLMRVLDREHRLGHASWISVHTRQEWNTVFLRQIVPLLQEYFYNDWDNLRTVLGENSKSEIVRELPTLDGIKSRTRYAWWFDCDENPTTPDFLGVLARNFKLPSTPPSLTPQESAFEEEPAPEGRVGTDNE